MFPNEGTTKGTTNKLGNDKAWQVPRWQSLPPNSQHLDLEGNPIRWALESLCQRAMLSALDMQCAYMCLYEWNGAQGRMGFSRKAWLESQGCPQGRNRFLFLMSFPQVTPTPGRQVTA